MKVFKELYQYRELLKTNVKKEVRGKYKASFLGVLWSFVNPLLQVLVYALVFPYIMRLQTDNYLVFLICGIIPWTWFLMSLSVGTTCITSNSNLIKKVYFPREILPISNVTSGLINFAISCVIILLFVIFGGLGVTWHLIFLPLVMFIQYVLTLGILFITCAFNVYLRDTEYIVGFVLNMFFYATPILYNYKVFEGSKLMWIFKLNPLAHIVNAYRDIFYLHYIPHLDNLAIVFGFSVLLLIVGYLIFKKLEKGFAEEL